MPVIQFSNGGAQFNAGKGLSMQAEKQQSLVELLNKTYSYFGRSLQTTVILHTDHCAKKLLPWIDGLLDASEKHFAETGKIIVFFTHDRFI
jgi:fructose-bisphosphate aldolase class II